MLSGKYQDSWGQVFEFESSTGEFYDDLDRVVNPRWPIRKVTLGPEIDPHEQLKRAQSLPAGTYANLEIKFWERMCSTT